MLKKLFTGFSLFASIAASRYLFSILLSRNLLKNPPEL